MKQNEWLDALAYSAVAVVAVSFAFLFSLRFLGHSLGQEPPPASPPAAASDTKSPPSAETAAAVAAEIQGYLEPFLYDSKNRRDPFQTYADFRPAENVQALSPLQRYDLDEFKLVGIMWDVRNPRAMFVDPEKVVHVASRDDSIGKKNGYIATIREGEVVVVESFRKDGEVQFKPRVIHMDR